MPIVNGAYEAPTWNNDAPPAINAAELQDICDTIETYNTSKADVSYVNTFVRPNLLDNAYFVGGGSQQGGGQFPINQRGATSYTSNGYYIDRWAKVSGSGSVSLVSSGLTISATTETILFQYFETPSDIIGRTCTLSVLTTDGLYTSTFTVSASSTDGYKATSFGSISLSAWSNKKGARIVVGSGKSVTLLAGKLELGSNQTLAHQDGGVWVLNEIPNFEVELAKYQRYFQNLNLAGSNYLALGFGTARSETRVDILTYLPVPLRTSPTISYTGNFSVSRGTTSHGVSAMAVDVFFGSLIKINCTTTGLTVGETLGLQTSGAGTLMLSADL